MYSLSITDSIEANIENAAVQVERGTTQLDQARNYQVLHHAHYVIIYTVLLLYRHHILRLYMYCMFIF